MDKYQSILDTFDDSFGKYAESPALSNFGKVMTFKELDRLSSRFASHLINNLGLSKHDRVALMMPNILQFPVALFGVLKAGLVAVNVNPLYTERELEHVLKDSGAKAIVIFESAASKLQAVLETSDIKHIFVTNIGDMLSFPKSILINFVLKWVKKVIPSWNIPQAKCFTKILKEESADDFRPLEIKREDPALYQYTGGTTGVSKAAVLSHGNIVSNILMVRDWMSVSTIPGEEICIVPLPLYHILPLIANLLTFGSKGDLNVLITNPRDINGFIKELKKWKWTVLTGVNTLFNTLLEHPEFETLDFTRVKICIGGGMAVQKPIAEHWKKVTGKVLLEGYGLTETSPVICLTPLDAKDYTGFAGLPISSTIIQMRNEEGKEVPLGEPGEICVSGPQVMEGYLNRPDETKKVFFDDGFFRTGDIGIMNTDGWVKIVDRKKDMILVSGFNVYPNEIEEVIATHPKVLEVAVVGVPDKKSGETVKAFIVKRDESLDEEEVMDYCKGQLTGYKRPKYLEFRKELPKSNVGKILRKDLRVRVNEN
jgi:long-chain acyl-CoA synthetase